MHHRRIAAFLTGVWIAGSVIIAFIALQNMGSVDRLMTAPSGEASKIIQKLGHQPAMLFLRYQAAEMNRQYLSRWELTQLALAAILAAILYLGTHVNRLMVVVCGVVALIVGFMHFVLTPEIIFLGRELDFVVDRGRRLWTLYALYAGLDILKVLLVSVIAGYLFVFKTRTRPRGTREGAAEFETADR